MINYLNKSYPAGYGTVQLKLGLVFKNSAVIYSPTRREKSPFLWFEQLSCFCLYSELLHSAHLLLIHHYHRVAFHVHILFMEHHCLAVNTPLDLGINKG